MERREFLKYSAIFGTSLLAPSMIYGNTGPEIIKDKKIKEKNLVLKIFEDESNFNYGGKILTEEWANKLENKGLEYIVDRSKNILNENKREYTAVFESRVLDMSIDSFKKLITVNPYFIIPLITDVLIDSNKTKDGIAVAAKIEDGDLEKGLWYVEKENVGNKIKGKVSIPYSDNEKMLVYGDGKRWGVKGEFISLINYKEVDGKTSLATCFFVDSVGTGFFSNMYAGGPFVANKVKDNAMDLFENSVKLVKGLRDKSIKINDRKYGEKKVSYLNELDI